MEGILAREETPSSCRQRTEKTENPSQDVRTAAAPLRKTRTPSLTGLLGQGECLRGEEGDPENQHENISASES